MNNLLQKICDEQDIPEIYDFAIKKLYSEGPTSITVLEVFSYLKIFSPDFFKNIEDEILEIMCVYYKSPQTDSLFGKIFSLYNDSIKERFKTNYTPIQASIISQIEKNQNFSFSAPTSTGKSFVFRDLISKSLKDFVIIVPSRALINEYFDKTLNLILDKHVNVLTHVDIINTKNSSRNIFILTPERSSDLFKYKKELDIEMFLFDEAQLSSEESKRGLYYDSIVRRIKKNFPAAKCIFSHPFIENPHAQFTKNKFLENEVKSIQYRQKNVGQIFYAFDGMSFYHFGIETDQMGKKKVKSSFDPLQIAIESNRSILVYTTKSSIYKKDIMKQFSKYLNLCAEINDPLALEIIDKLEKFIGSADKYYYSNMIDWIKKGIVIHHGSLPLQARMMLEHFTQSGFCKICFATSTLEQGINMPFDVVFLNTFQASKTLSMKNLIGRAGRSTLNNKFDYGSIVIKLQNMSTFRNVMLNKEKLNEISLLDIIEEDEDEEYKDFKDAINNDKLSDEYNLTENKLKLVDEKSFDEYIIRVIESLFENDKLIPIEKVNKDKFSKLSLFANFLKIYQLYLGNRELSNGEKSVFTTAIRILIWKVYGKSFKEICWFRYSYVARVHERRKIEKLMLNATSDEKERLQQMERDLEARFIRGYDEIPNKILPNYSIYDQGTKAVDVDYDRIVFDTYDYLDKIIGFRLSDIFYAIFHKYYLRENDQKALRIANFFKFGTDDGNEIMLLRYGFSFEEIEIIKPYVITATTEELLFRDGIKEICSKNELETVKRFLY